MTFTKCEWNEDVLQGAITGCTMLVGFLNVVAEETGRDKALEMLKKFGAEMGVETGEMCKQQLGDQDLNVEKLAEFVIGTSSASGERNEVEHRDGSFRYRVYDCPFAEAFKALGTDLEAGKSICESLGAVFCQNFMKVIAPKGEWELSRFRENWDDYCEERYQLGD